MKDGKEFWDGMEDGMVDFYYETDENARIKDGKTSSSLFHSMSCIPRVKAARRQDFPLYFKDFCSKMSVRKKCQKVLKSQGVFPQSKVEIYSNL